MINLLGTENHGNVVEGQTCRRAKDANSNLQPTIYVTI